MKPVIAALASASMVLLVSAPAQAQWLGPTLDAQRWTNLSKHQQEQRRKAQERQRQQQQSSPTSPEAPENVAPPTLRERQAAWNANKTEYRQRLLRDGQQNADRWLDQVALANRRAS